MECGVWIINVHQMLSEISIFGKYVQMAKKVPKSHCLPAKNITPKGIISGNCLLFILLDARIQLVRTFLLRFLFLVIFWHCFKFLENTNEFRAAWKELYASCFTAPHSFGRKTDRRYEFKHINILLKYILDTYTVVCIFSYYSIV